MKGRKKFLALSLSMALSAGALSGCGSDEPAAGSIDGYDEGEKYLSIWVHSIEDTEEGQVYRECVDAFNEAYDGEYFADIEFIPRNDSGGGYSDKINASVMSGSLPDVLTVDGPNVAAYAANEIIQPLAEIPDEELAEYLPSIITQGTYHDELYALGVMESSVGLYYNKDILEEAGVEVPDADDPWTFTEFLDVLEQVKTVTDELDGYPLDMTFPTGESTIYYYAPFIWSNGGDFVSEDGLTVDGIFNSATNASTVDYFKTILADGYMSSVPITNLFESGRAAFKFDGTWEVNTIRTSYPDVDLGVAPYIVGDDWDGGRYTPTGSWAFAASSTTDDLEGATELVKWMSGVESGKRMWSETKTFPSTYEAFAAFDDFETDELYAALYSQLETYGHPRPITPAYPQVSSCYQQVLEDAVLSGQDTQETLDKAVLKIDDKLERYEDQ